MSAVDQDLWYNPQLVSDLLFSPHPVLIEGDRDLAAFQSAARRLGCHSSVSQTDFVKCNGCEGVARWLEIGLKLELELQAVADLDAIFSAKLTEAADKVPGIKAAYMQQWQAQCTSEVLEPICEAMAQAGIGKNRALRREWLCAILASNDEAVREVRTRSEKLLAFWRNAGIWIHPQGDLEGALGLSDKCDARECARRAKDETQFDDVVRWALFRFDKTKDVQALLNLEVERIAQDIQRSMRGNPACRCSSPVGIFAEGDSRLVAVEPFENGKHVITVKEPAEFHGWWLAFDRSTPPDSMQLRPPE